ncbi:RNA recognition motif domain [Dillenia turbinata]|uniref:RNA recognition motif domain n=1 Tax=Dillenia turbinata TaxID=194707 RepID=A0AAN8VLR0_9MAGN
MLCNGARVVAAVIADDQISEKDQFEMMLSKPNNIETLKRQLYRFMRDSNGSKGFGFVSFSSALEAKRAITLLGGKMLRGSGTKKRGEDCIYASSTTAQAYGCCEYKRCQLHNPLSCVPCALPRSLAGNLKVCNKEKKRNEKKCSRLRNSKTMKSEQMIDEEWIQEKTNGDGELMAVESSG